MSESTLPPRHDPPDAGSWAAQPFAAGGGRAVPAPPPVLAPELRTGIVVTALLAGAGAALASGLVWAGVVIVTRFDIGLLAWVGGAATGWAIVRVAGGPVGVGARVLAGLFAAAGIMVGKYVIFVHDVRKLLTTQYAASGQSVGYLDPQQVSVFVHHFGSLVRPIYAVWLAIAFLAAVRTAGGKPLLRRRR